MHKFNKVKLQKCSVFPLGFLRHPAADFKLQYSLQPTWEARWERRAPVSLLWHIPPAVHTVFIGKLTAFSWESLTLPNAPKLLSPSRKVKRGFQLRNNVLPITPHCSSKEATRQPVCREPRALRLRSDEVMQSTHLALPAQDSSPC